MYAVDGAYDYPRRHPNSPPLSVDGQQDYTSAPYSDHSNQFLDGYQHRDDRFGYAGGGASESSYPQNNQFRDDFDQQFNYRSVSVRAMDPRLKESVALYGGYLSPISKCAEIPLGKITSQSI